ncbi:cation:proton antiporter regulatory subunit [Halocalculus aciditolerans]|uniref:Potassium transporter TrkA n=1 Tax=Halocalculus aciditolerans TaxID=1383812 RepID=A0A830FAP5_9EURY|nr:cation:proton antiporter regulatory subunit [Halocalculus aciditolerans]GGL56312.1 potassium transporter TrkA [Halocalculus aciditolerans]
MVIYEADVPGVGKRYEVEADDGSRLVVIVHHDGKREIFRRPNADADAEKLFDLSSTQAKDAANVLQGADFQPLDLDNADVPLGGAVIEWVTVPETSPLVGETFADAGIREHTGVTVAAVQRGDDTLASPGARTTLEAGDVLVVVGTREDQQALETLLRTGSLD